MLLLNRRDAIEAVARVLNGRDQTLAKRARDRAIVRMRMALLASELPHGDPAQHRVLQHGAQIAAVFDQQHAIASHLGARSLRQERHDCRRAHRSQVFAAASLQRFGNRLGFGDLRVVRREAVVAFDVARRRHVDERESSKLIRRQVEHCVEIARGRLARVGDEERHEIAAAEAAQRGDRRHDLRSHVMHEEHADTGERLVRRARIRHGAQLPRAIQERVGVRAFAASADRQLEHTAQLRNVEVDRQRPRIDAHDGARRDEVAQLAVLAREQHALQHRAHFVGVALEQKRLRGLRPLQRHALQHREAGLVDLLEEVAVL